MAKKRIKKASNESTEFERASPESEARFPAHLSPIIQCKKSVLDRTRIEFYSAIIIGGIEAVIPMSGLTRSLILFVFVLAPLVDLIWRSTVSHAWKTSSKFFAIFLLIAIYSATAGTLITHEHQTAARSLQEYLKSGRAEWLIRCFYFLGGAVVLFLTTKVFSFVQKYMSSRRSEKLAIRQRFRETRRGWLDYRLDSEEASKRLHALSARMHRVIRGMAFVLSHISWFIGKEDEERPVMRAQATASVLAVVFDKCSARLEPDLKEFEVAANLFIESTEGYLKTLRIVTKQDYMQLAGLHEYFDWQLKDVREIANVLGQFPPAFEGVRGVSQDLTAAINRQATIWRFQIGVLRRIEGHCARMVKTTQAYFDRAMLSASEELLSKLIDLVKLMGGDEGMKEYRRLLKERGLTLPSQFA